MEYRDKTLKCVECGSDFVFTSGEQAFYADRGFKNEPKRCKNCKGKRGASPGGAGSHRSETTTKCSQCGKETTVPFKPTQGRPVYCRECFQQRRAAGATAG
jgi:CxxC-x17-CxxC domain-containing protein